MLFEMWLDSRGYKIDKLSKKEGRSLYKQFGQEMIPAIRDCTNFLNVALSSPNQPLDSDAEKPQVGLTVII